ncbi:hypothetical protein GCM10010240_36480 [Streptomyces griseoviridis]|nr:hypothetical protein GCM10010240_36480 [Streptomyces griseoviridis]
MRLEGGPRYPVEEILGALDALVRAGKVRHIAASNISVERLQESLDFSERESLARSGPRGRTRNCSPAAGRLLVPRVAGAAGGTTRCA